MGALGLMMIGIGIFGGITMIASSSKNIKPITFPSSFYENLEYFKKDGNVVIAVKKDNDDEVIFNGTSNSSKSYFESVQKGFEEWLDKNDHFSKSGSTVKFS